MCIKKVLFINTPPHTLKYDIDVKSLFRYFDEAFYLRYVSGFNLDKIGGDDTDQRFYYVIKDGEFSFDTLSAKVRNMVRRCLKNCIIERTTAEAIVQNGGYDVFLSEYRRFAKSGFGGDVNSFDVWKSGIENTKRRGEDLWGVFFEGRVVAYGVTCVQDDMVNLVTWKCDYEKYKNFYPSYGLVYKMTEYYLQQPKIKYVNDGNRSFTQHSHVQDFLIDKFGYRKVYVRLHAYFKWWLKLLILLVVPFERYIHNNVLLSFIRMYKWSR